MRRSSAPASKVDSVRLPPSIQQGAERAAAREGSSLSDFVASAVAERLRAADFFEEVQARVDWDAFDRLLARNGGEPPRAGDERD